MNKFNLKMLNKSEAASEGVCYLNAIINQLVMFTNTVESLQILQKSVRFKEMTRIALMQGLNDSLLHLLNLESGVKK